jgi:hypothetical protein
MHARNIKVRPLSAAIAMLVAAAGAGSCSAVAGPVLNDGVGAAKGPDPHIVLDAAATKPGRYFVQFVEAPLALYDGSDAQLATIPRANGADGRRKLDSHSAQAQQYVAHLATVQAQHLTGVSNTLGRSVKALRSMHHALNAAVVEMTPSEAERARKVTGVLAVRPVGTRVLATDLGPQFIGATSLWTSPDGVSDDLFHAAFDGNMPQSHYDKALGDGIVVGDLDTGYNSLSPSFSQTDDTGYTITNPLGTGHYLGECAWRGISTAGCNNKVIGVYDMVTDAGDISVEDTQGHGSHTASTAAGNSRSATINGYTAHISGIAPHANLVIFHACAPQPTNCPEDALANAADQAVADGVVDVLNYSISGGVDPWNDVVSQAFLSAEAAGIFIAAAAGNTGAGTPLAVAGTANHFEPWVSTVAAGNHNGGAIAPIMTVTGPGSPPSNVLSIALDETQGDTHLSASIPGSTPIKLSPQFDIAELSGTDGCSGYPAGTFTNSIALVSRGTCTIVTKVASAYAAGAIAVVVADNRPEAPTGFSMSPTQSIPAFSITQADGVSLQSFLAANGNSGTAAIPNNPVRQHAQPDQLAVFSLLGPAPIDVMKPDVQAPGTNILAAVANDGTANGPNVVALFDGTSMATPHTTGAGALLANLHRDWTPMEIKSALMLTAKEAGLTKPDGVTPSDYFDRGSGRIMVDVANKAGLVLDESPAHMQGANPVLGGDGVGALNLASMQNGSCAAGATKTCAFTRTFHGAADHAVTWTASYSGDAAMNVSIVPASFSVTGGGFKTVTFNVNAAGVPSNGAFRFGEVTLTPSDASLPKLHLPVAVAVQPPAIAVAPTSLTFSIPNTSFTADQVLTVANVGGPTLNVTDTNFVDAVPQYAMVTIDQTDISSFGAYSSYFTDLHGGRYATDDFTVTDAATNLGLISLPGFTTANTPLSALAATGVHFRIYHDVGGRPDGAPEAPLTPPNNAPAWQFDTTLGHAGVDVTNDLITLDLAAAGAPATNLAPGTYWLVVYPDMNAGLNGGWAVVLANTGSGSNGLEISPTGAPTGTAEKDWTAFNGYAGIVMHIEQKVACGAPWLSTVPSSLSLGGAASAPVTVTVDSSNFDGGVTSEVGYLCLKSNDAGKPTTVIRVGATQN